VFVASFFFNSRLRTRRAIFCLRNRPDLALSPFLNDIPHYGILMSLAYPPAAWSRGVERTRFEKDFRVLGKGNKQRLLPLPAETIEVLQNYLRPLTNSPAVFVSKPGGMVVIEGFQEDESKEVGFRLGHGVNEVLRAFDRLRIVFYEDTIGPADWNDGKPAPIVRFIARKEK